MKKWSLFILCLFPLWWLFFAFQRLLFVINYAPKFGDVDFSVLFQAFFEGFRLDLSTIGYLLIPLFLVFLIFFYFLNGWTIRALRLTLIIQVFFLALIHAAELNAYGEWGHKLSSRVFMHLLSPSEVLRTTGYAAGLWTVLFIAIEFSLGWSLIHFLYKRLSVEQERPSRWVGGLWCMVGMSLSFLFIRGGVQQIPINIDSAYFSSNPIVNDVAVNSAYYFGNSFLLYNRSDIGEFAPKQISKSQQISANEFYTQHNSDQTLLSAEKPNVVFIILEGWSSHGVGAITKMKSATPFFDKLSKEGVLFTHIYATNTTSEIGNATILSGFSGIPESAITLFPEKHRRLPTVSSILKKRGYETSYLFSGDLKYGNIQGFLMDHDFDLLEDEQDFQTHLPKGKLNFYDEDLFTKLLDGLKAKKQPFFSCVFTGSTHFPYDCPMKKTPFSGEEANYLNSMIYADDCLKDFFTKARTQSWYKNTIFVLVSDHGHASPVSTSPYDPEFFRIPLLFVGPALNADIKGLVLNRMGSQADIATTLMMSMGIESKPFLFSRNLMSQKTEEGAFLSTIRGYGFVAPKAQFMFNFDSKTNLNELSVNSNERKRAQNLGSSCFFQLHAFFKALDEH